MLLLRDFCYDFVFFLPIHLSRVISRTKRDFWNSFWKVTYMNFKAEIHLFLDIACDFTKFPTISQNFPWFHEILILTCYSSNHRQVNAILVSGLHFCDMASTLVVLRIRRLSNWKGSKINVMKIEKFSWNHNWNF